MNKDGALDSSKRLALGLGEKSAAFVVAELTHDGKISLSWFSNTDANAVYLQAVISHLMGTKNVQKLFEAKNETQ